MDQGFRDELPTLARVILAFDHVQQMLETSGGEGCNRVVMSVPLIDPRGILENPHAEQSIT